MRALDLLHAPGINELDNIARELCLKVAEELSQKVPASLRRKLWAAVDQDFDSIYPILCQWAKIHPVVQTLREWLRSPQGNIPRQVSQEAEDIIMSVLEVGQREADVEQVGPFFELLINETHRLLRHVFSNPLIAKLDPFYIYAILMVTIQDGYDKAGEAAGDRRLFWPYEDTGLPIGKALEERIYEEEGFRPLVHLDLTPEEEAVIMTKVNDFLVADPLKSIEDTYGVQLQKEDDDRLLEQTREKIRQHLALARLQQLKSCQGSGEADPK